MMIVIINRAWPGMTWAGRVKGVVWVDVS